MTQQKRIAEEDLNRCKLNGGFIYDEVLPYWIKEAERMRARADQLASESSSQFVSTTNALMRAEAAEQELEAQRIRADKAEQLINTIDEALDEEFKLGEWDDFMNLIHKEITAYRESSTDGHTS
ncbi:hypothetical protein ACFSGI_08905 [Paenibacillus nicotianae]|uniref:Uncharacterized protein n=1 Tax=Paenibacillus nicotianae TaxID=1526551 RepID=A0ABW4URX3_9BACL